MLIALSPDAVTQKEVDRAKTQTISMILMNLESRVSLRRPVCLG
jgi:hypothetical protein